MHQPPAKKKKRTERIPVEKPVVFFFSYNLFFYFYFIYLLLLYNIFLVLPKLGAGALG